MLPSGKLAIQEYAFSMIALGCPGPEVATRVEPLDLCSAQLRDLCTVVAICKEWGSWRRMQRQLVNALGAALQRA